jgi:hypothetical protein
MRKAKPFTVALLVQCTVYPLSSIAPIRDLPVIFISDFDSPFFVTILIIRGLVPNNTGERVLYLHVVNSSALSIVYSHEFI